MFHRSLILIVILTLVIIFVFFGTQSSIEVPLLKPLETLNRRIGQWEYEGEVRLQNEIVDMLGVDDYIEYVYKSAHNQKIDLYVSYFSSLKEGKQFHSPKNCLVGAGSFLMKAEKVDIPINNGQSASVPVNVMHINNRGQKQTVIYWFQCRGRYIRSEYTEKIFRVVDSIFYNRTDGAFIRVIGTGKNEEDVLGSMINFTAQIIPILEEYIPGRQIHTNEVKN